MPVFVEGENPAISLFNFWSEFCGTETRRVAQWSAYGNINCDEGTIMPWGARDWGIGQFVSHDATQSGFVYGRIYGRRNSWSPPSIETRFVLLSDGRFAFSNQHGDDNRRNMSRGTFLSIQRSASRYRWLVDPHLTYESLYEWDVDQHPSASQRATSMGGKLGSLWQLEKRDGVWVISLADNQTTAWQMQHNGAGFETIRATLRREERARQGRNKRRDDNTNPRVSSPGFFADPDNLAQIVALLEVDEPVKNTPHIRTRRLLEAS
jgi:hypothetical protein